MYSGLLELQTQAIDPWVMGVALLELATETLQALQIAVRLCGAYHFERSQGHLAAAIGDISDTFHFLYKEVIIYLEEKGRDFEKVVKKKRVLYGLQAAV